MHNNTNIELWHKPMGEFTPADWDAAESTIRTMMECAIVVTNNTISIRMLCDEARTGTTQYSAGGIGKGPPVHGKAAAQFLAGMVDAANVPIDVSTMTVEQMYNALITYLQAGVEFQTACAAQTEKFAAIQPNKMYTTRCVDGAKQLLNKTKDAVATGTNLKARSIILLMWDDFRKHKLDNQIGVPVLSRSYAAFFDYCGDMFVRESFDGTKRTVNDWMPDGEKTLEDWLHTRSQEKYTRNKYGQK